MVRFLRSVGFALCGVRQALGGRNFILQLVVALVVIIAGLWFAIKPIQWCILLMCIIIVLAAEAMNTAIEHVCNMYTTAYNDHVRAAKDIAAGAVLITAVGAAIVGFIIFIPYIRR